MKGMAGWFCFVLLLGVTIGFRAGGGGDAQAQVIDNHSTRWLAGTVSFGQWQDAFLLFDTQTHRLMAYTVSPMKRLDLLSVREISWDLRPVEFGKQHPSVKDMKDRFEESLKKEEERKSREK